MDNILISMLNKEQMNTLNCFKKIHTLIGVFISPFIFIAALSGAVYAFSYALENLVYKDLLFYSETGTAQDISLQVKTANQKIVDRLKRDRKT